MEWPQAQPSRGRPRRGEGVRTAFLADGRGAKGRGGDEGGRRRRRRGDAWAPRSGGRVMGGEGGGEWVTGVRGEGGGERNPAAGRTGEAPGLEVEGRAPGEAWREALVGGGLDRIEGGRPVVEPGEESASTHAARGRPESGPLGGPERTSGAALGRTTAVTSEASPRSRPRRGGRQRSPIAAKPSASWMRITCRPAWTQLDMP